MAGFVRASLEQHNDLSIDVIPDDCPVEHPHFVGTMRCYTIMFDGERRACTYWQACTHVANTTHRVDPSYLLKALEDRNVTRLRCGVVCARMRANRPPGC